MGSGQRKSGLAVIKSRVQPRRCCVAERAVLREACRGMVGICRFVEIGEVAGTACSRRPRESVVRVTLDARDRGVGAGQWERRLIVVEDSVQPRRRGMTHGAVLREARSRVVGVCGLFEICEVTRDALGGRAGETVVCMALTAVNFDVRPGQRERRFAVVEYGTLPIRRVVAK